MSTTQSITIFYTGKEQCCKNHSFGPAIRPNYLLHVILDGCGTYEVNHQQYHLHRGDCFLIHPNETTVYTADSTNPWSYAWVSFDGYEISSILENTEFTSLQGNHYTCKPNHTDEFIDRMLALVDTAATGHHNEYESLSLFYGLCATLYSSTEKANNPNEETYLLTAYNYIIRNYMNDIKVQDIAHEVGIDRTYLYKIFRKLENCSPKQFLTNLRIKASMNLLADSQYSITQVAYYSGFQDSTSFCHHFKKHTNMTPRQYRIYQQPIG